MFSKGKYSLEDTNMVVPASTHPNIFKSPDENRSVITRLPADVLLNNCSQKFRKFFRKTPVSNSVFNKKVD